MIYWELFVSFLKVGVLSFGGGYAAMPLIQEEMIHERGWISMNEFADLITIAEMTPGPIAVNSATFVGNRIAGVWGGIVATLGCISPSILIVSLLALIYHKYKGVPLLDRILGTLRAAVVALILGAGLSLLQNAIFYTGTNGNQSLDLLGVLLFLLAFFLLRRGKWNPIVVMCFSGLLGFALQMVFVVCKTVFI